MVAAKTINDVLMFAAELVAWAAFGVWGWYVVEAPWRWVLVIVLPLAVIGLWAVFAAPNSGSRLTDPWLLVFQLAVFLIGAALYVAAERPVWGWTFGALALVVVVLDRVLGRLVVA